MYAVTSNASQLSDIDHEVTPVSVDLTGDCTSVPGMDLIVAYFQISGESDRKTTYDYRGYMTRLCRLFPDVLPGSMYCFKITFASEYLVHCRFRSESASRTTETHLQSAFVEARLHFAGRAVWLSRHCSLPGHWPWSRRRFTSFRPSAAYTSSWWATVGEALALRAVYWYTIYFEYQIHYVFNKACTKNFNPKTTEADSFTSCMHICYFNFSNFLSTPCSTRAYYSLLWRGTISDLKLFRGVVTSARCFMAIW